MASVSRKYKEAQELDSAHDIERSTAKIPKERSRRKDRIARARRDYRYFVRTLFSPPLRRPSDADFQVDAAV